MEITFNKTVWTLIDGKRNQYNIGDVITVDEKMAAYYTDRNLAAVNVKNPPQTIQEPIISEVDQVIAEIKSSTAKKSTLKKIKKGIK